MSMGTSNLHADDEQLKQSFHELRAWVDARMSAKGLERYSLPQTRGEAQAITLSDIDQLKEDIALLIQLEGRRSFWSGLIINAVFFVLGLLAGSAVEFVKTGFKWPF